MTCYMINGGYQCDTNGTTANVIAAAPNTTTQAKAGGENIFLTLQTPPPDPSAMWNTFVPLGFASILFAAAFAVVALTLAHTRGVQLFKRGPKTPQRK